MELSDEQIKQLFQFTEEQGVDYYDVQIELVDHLATNIEVAISEDETLTFSEALKMAFDSFGVAGFEEVLKEKSRAAKARNCKMLINEAKQWLTFHRLMLLLALCSMIFFVGIVFEPVVRAYMVMAISIGLQFRMLYILLAETYKKDLLLLQFGWLEFSFFPGFPVVFFLIVEICKAVQSQPIERMIGPVLLFLAFQISACNVRTQLKQQARKLYPEAFAKPSAAKAV
jgi:hypothetical protein